jgi:hypothetical protein
MGVMDNYNYNKSQQGSGGFVDRATKWSNQTSGGKKGKGEEGADTTAYAPSWKPELTPARRPSGDRWVNDYSKPPDFSTPSGFGVTPSSGSMREQDRNLGWSISVPQPSRRSTGDRWINNKWVPPAVVQDLPAFMSQDEYASPANWGIPDRKQTGDRRDEQKILPSLPITQQATGAGGSVGNTALAPTIPTGSFLAANGRAALNGDQSASWLDLPQFPTGTFFGAGGEAVRGPDASYLLYGNKNNGGYGGYGGGGWGGGGGGGWNSRSWGGNNYGGYDPKMGLYSWNFKG